MSIYVLGINHKTASVTIREKAFFALDKLALYLQDLQSRQIAQEAVLLSTCNRSELYCVAYDVDALRAWFCEQTSLSRQELDASLYIYQEQAAISHIMQVASGLDSMILGEPQILGQMKTAFSESCSAGTVDSVFHRLFQQIFTVAKEIRTSTAIGACPVSMASTAAYFAKQQHVNFSDANIAIIGAGETALLLMRYLRGQLKNPITIINRSKEKATALLNEFGGCFREFNEIPNVLNTADIIFSATGSAHPIIQPAMFNTIARKKLLTLIDIAVPRDIAPEVQQVPQVNLYSIDDLKDIITHHRQGREHAATKALEMIASRSKACLSEIYSFDKVAHTIRAYRGQIEEICQAELMKAKQQLLQGEDPTQVLDTFSHAFMNKLMHAPSVQLRQAGAQGRYDLLRLAKQLFAIPDPEIESV